MADFMSNLWNGIFTPGPTPTLLLATNITFACLQLTLAALLAATLSIHFVVLSFLCGGLWWAINWFADELRQAQEKEQEASRIRQNTPKKSRSHVGEGEASETEVDMGHGVIKKFSKEDAEYTPTEQDEEIRSQVLSELGKSGVASSSVLVPSAGESRQRQGNSDMSASSNEFGTDSEWIKVDDD